MNVIDFASEDLVKATGLTFWEHIYIISKATNPIVGDFYSSSEPGNPEAFKEFVDDLVFRLEFIGESLAALILNCYSDSIESFNPALVSNYAAELRKVGVLDIPENGTMTSDDVAEMFNFMKAALMVFYHLQHFISSAD